MVRLMLGSYDSQQCFQLASTIRHGVDTFCKTTTHAEKCLDCTYRKSCLDLLHAADYAEQLGKQKNIGK